MPTLDRLAKNGLTYTQWHTTAVCSPTRSCFLTGRNHHANGFGSISESATGFPGYNGHIPLENGTIASILRDAGWSTFWVGKNHNVPVDAFGMSSSKKRWPLGLGYDRFYSFIGGETNQWFPELIEDNHFVDQPAQPKDGHHFSKDIADKAITFIRDSKQGDPDDLLLRRQRRIRGASGEGSPSGSVNENLFFNGFPDDVSRNLPMIDKLGSPDAYNHYPTGWAVAFSTPYRMFKRYASYAGGTCDPMVIHWPQGIKAKGEVRHQYHHCTDIVPTILEACGVPMPELIDGVKQAPLAGVSMLYSFDSPDAPATKQTQYYEMLGTRGIWSKGWKAATIHAPLTSDQGNFDKAVWQLFHTDTDRAEARDLAAEHPDKLKELVALWFSEAEKNNVLPLVDLGVRAMHEAEYHAPKRDRYVYYPGTIEVPEAAAARTLGVSFNMLAEVEFTGDSQGVIVPQGSRFGGYSLFVKGGKLFYVYNFLGIPPEQRLVCDAPKLGKHIVGVEFVSCTTERSRGVRASLRSRRRL